MPCYQDREVQVNLVSIPPIQQLSNARRSTEDEETNTLSLTQQAYYYYSSESEVTSSCISSLAERNSNSSGCEIQNQRITSNNYFVPLTTVCVPQSEPESGEKIFYISPPAEKPASTVSCGDG